MARNAGEWYEEKRLEAERLAAELTHARHRVDHLQVRLEAACEIVRRLERQLELARYVGD